MIEAGGFYQRDNGNLSTVPGYGLSIPFLDTKPTYPQNSAMDWNYVSVPQTQAGDRQIHYAQGKTLGGSSAINSMAYHRATVGAHQKWADLVGDQSYTWQNFLPYFEKSAELKHPDFAKRDTPNATFQYDPSVFSNGPLTVSYATWVDPTITWLAKAIRSLGLPESSLGLNSGTLSGSSAFVTTTVNQDEAVRTTSFNSYLEKVGLGAGLRVYHNTRATKIVFSGKQASGVQVTTGSSDYTLKAIKEVILSAGVFGSPHLLMVSGVGPGSTLQSYDIPVVSDLPGVGKNFWDQLFFQVVNLVKTPSGPQEVAVNPQLAKTEYKKLKWGPFSSISAYIAYEKLPQSARTSFSQSTNTALSWFPR